MGIFVDDIREFATFRDDEGRKRESLGQRLQGMADEVDVDSVEAVRDIRERNE